MHRRWPDRGKAEDYIAMSSLIDNYLPLTRESRSGATSHWFMSETPLGEKQPDTAVRHTILRISVGEF